MIEKRQFNLRDAGPAALIVRNSDSQQWVRHIFGRYVLGDSPRKIAQSLNEQGVASSRGGTWAHTALYPDVKGVGMLGNPMYAGRPVWNRTKWLHHPVSGKRVRSMRPESEWVITEDPALRIVDEDVWQAACGRAANQRHRTSDRKTVGAGVDPPPFAGEVAVLQ